MFSRANHFVMDACDGLNPSQCKAVLAEAPYLLIQAGPGTGKTRVLVHRILHLINNRGISPEAILPITFTRHAAHELRQRVQSACSFSVRARTFHAWAHDFIRNWQRACLNPPDTPGYLLTEAEAVSICNNMVASLNLNKKRNWYALLSQARQYWPFRFPDSDLQLLYESYEGYLNEQGLYDYDHLLFSVLKVMQSPAGKAFFADRISHVLVDEFQDVNGVQYELLRHMAQAGVQITVIGDVNQAIYGFRGASPAFMRMFLEDFEGAKSIGLDEVYRCPQIFLDAAQAVVPSDSGQMLISKIGMGNPIHLHGFDDAFQEANWVAQEIERLVGGFSMERADHAMSVRSLGDIAVLYRTHGIGELIRQRLQERGIPCTWSVGKTENSPDLQQVLQVLRQNTHDYLNVKEGLHQLLQFLGITRPSQEISVFLQLAEGVSTFDELYDLASVFSSVEEMEREPFGVHLESVSMLSMHAAKGLEFPVVFLIGMEEGLFPLSGADEAEEARLCYVAMTRAKERLYVSWCRQRLQQDFMKSLGQPSRFIDKILPYAVLEEQKSTKKGKRPKQKRLF